MISEKVMKIFISSDFRIEQYKTTTDGKTFTICPTENHFSVVILVLKH